MPQSHMSIPVTLSRVHKGQFVPTGPFPSFGSQIIAHAVDAGTVEGDALAPGVGPLSFPPGFVHYITRPMGQTPGVDDSFGYEITSRALDFISSCPDLVVMIVVPDSTFVSQARSIYDAFKNNAYLSNVRVDIMSGDVDFPLLSGLSYNISRYKAQGNVPLVFFTMHDSLLFTYLIEMAQSHRDTEFWFLSDSNQPIIDYVPSYSGHATTPVNYVTAVAGNGSGKPSVLSPVNQTPPAQSTPPSILKHKCSVLSMHTPGLVILGTGHTMLVNGHLVKSHIIPGSVKITTIGRKGSMCVYDDGNGKFTGDIIPSAHNNIDYASGRLIFCFVDEVMAGLEIKAEFEYDASAHNSYTKSVPVLTSVATPSVVTASVGVDESLKSNGSVLCECGGDRSRTTHSTWCPKFSRG